MLPLAATVVALGLAGASPATAHAQLEQAVRTALDARLAALGRPAEVRVTAHVDLEAAPAGALGFDIGPVAGRFPRAHAVVPVRVLVDGRLWRVAHVVVAMSEPRQVLAYADDYAAGTSLAAIALEPKEVDMTCCESPALVAGMAGRPMELTRAVTRGAPALQRDIGPMPAVHRGDAVQIEAGQGSVQLLASGTALEAGQVGNKISVRIGAAGQILTARVVASGKVAVHE